MGVRFQRLRYFIVCCSVRAAFKIWFLSYLQLEGKKGISSSYAEIYSIRVIGALQLGGYEREKIDSHLYIAVWDWRNDASSLFPCLLHLQHFKRNIDWPCHDAGKLGDQRDGWDGGWHLIDGDRGVSGRYRKFGIVIYGITAGGVLVIGTDRGKEEKGERPDCLCPIFAGILSYHASAVAAMKQMKAKGSLTVEAALVVPVVLFCILLILDQGLELYGEVVKTAQKQEMWEEFHPAEKFRKLEQIGELIGR